MTAPFPNSSDRDLDALRREQLAHEPSMDEILASIRSIISDDREPAAAKSAPGPQVLYPKPAPPILRAVSPETPAPAVGVEAATPKIVWNQDERTEEAKVKPQLKSESPFDDEPLVSPEANEAVTASFEQLSASVALQHSQMIESMAREMLRPMLKSWLDDNMPAIVERLVRAEIQRVARGAR